MRDRELGPHLVLLARDMTGYRSLCRLVSAAHLAGTKGVPRFTHALLAEHVEGLVALTGCRHGEIARRLLAGDRAGADAAARRLAERYPGDGLGAGFFVELQHHLLPDDDWLVAETGRPGRRARACRPSSPTTPTTRGRRIASCQDVLVCIRHGLTLEESAHLRRPNGEYYLKGATSWPALPPAEPARHGADRSWRARGREGLAHGRRARRRAARSTSSFERYRFPGFPCPAARRRSASWSGCATRARARATTR